MTQHGHATQAVLFTQLSKLVGACCVVTVGDNRRMRGTIESISRPELGEDLQQSINLSEFKVILQAGDVVIVSGASLSEIEAPL